jgi:hypothetical protein
MQDNRKRLTGIVKNQLDSGSAFAWTFNFGEEVFIRSVLAKHSGLKVGDTVSMVVIPNEKEDTDCEWFALNVTVLQDEDDMIDAEIEEYGQSPDKIREDLERAISVKLPVGDDFTWNTHLRPKAKPEPQRKWAEEAYMFLDVNGPATTSQIARAVGYSTANIRTYLCKMHDRGEIVRADIRTSSVQSKASATVWALELADFLPEENEL